MQYWLCVAMVVLLSACGALDDSEESNTDPVIETEATLDGLWIGKTSEYLAGAATATEFDTIVLFDGQTVYLLRPDEAQIGDYELVGSGASDWSIDLYPFANPDVENNFYVGERNNDRFQVDALFASETRLVLNFDNAARNGTSVLDLDTAQETNIDLNRVQGEWSTTDSVMYVNQEGGFQGSIQGCQWEGFLSKKSGSMLGVSIVRRNCAEFNPVVSRPAQGFAVIDGEGHLHFMVEQDSSFLWMKFASSTSTPADPDGADEEDPEVPAA